MMRNAGNLEPSSHERPRLYYNRRMARGWESKAVEDQIFEAETRKDARRKRRLTPAETERLHRKETLQLERARIVREMERAYMRRHLVMLERGLAHIDAELSRLEERSSGSESES